MKNLCASAPFCCESKTAQKSEVYFEKIKSPHWGKNANLLFGLIKAHCTFHLSWLLSPGKDKIVSFSADCAKGRKHKVIGKKHVSKCEF